MSGITLPLALAAGVVSFASPCFLPIVPVYVGYLAGETDRARDRRGTLLQACAFVAGFSVVFVALWVSIGLIGYVVGGYRDILRVIGGAVLVLMGLHVAGLIDIPVLSRTLRPIAAPAIMHSAGAPPVIGAASGVRTAASTRRSILLGVAFGAGWSPCIGPILGGVIGLASVSTTVGEGAALLTAYCLGLGLPFVLVALGADELHRRLRFFTRHAMGVALVSGALLVGAGFLMITDLFARLSGALPTIGL